MLQAFLPTHATRVVVYLKPVSARWGPTKLRQLCTEDLGIEPDGFTVFLFTNKARDSLLLYWKDWEGEQTLLKKLNKGAFLLPAPKQEGEPFVTMRPKALARLFR